MMLMRRGFIAGLFLALAISGAAGAAQKIEMGDVPPSDLGRDEDRNRIDLGEDRGKVVIVTFWASWCGPCLQELPVLETMQREAGPERLKVYAVNFKEGRDQFRHIKRKLKDFHLTLVRDRGRISKAWGVTSLPHMFMISKKGVVARIHLGYGEGMIDTLVDEINALLLADWPPEDPPGTL